MEILIIPFVALVVVIMFADLLRTQWRQFKHKWMSKVRDKRDP